MYSFGTSYKLDSCPALIRAGGLTHIAGFFYPLPKNVIQIERKAREGETVRWTRYKLVLVLAINICFNSIFCTFPYVLACVFCKYRRKNCVAYSRSTEQIGT